MNKDKELAFYKEWASDAHRLLVAIGYYYSKHDHFEKAQDLIAQWELRHKKEFAIEAGYNYCFDSTIDHDFWANNVRKFYENVEVTTTITGDAYRVHVHQATRKKEGINL